MDWLRKNVRPIKTINKKRNSYHVKHIAEDYYPEGYITNGAFIAAALIEGYTHGLPTDHETHNPSFGMSERSLKRLDDQRQGRRLRYDGSIRYDGSAKYDGQRPNSVLAYDAVSGAYDDSSSAYDDMAYDA